jgi:glycosyltransferase involved in cell wall biosynthesis
VATSDLPTIGIVTPCLNQAEFLEQTIQSVLSQQYPKLQYVIMDGGSTDASVEIIERYAGSLHHWTSGPDGGQYAAIDAGMAHTDADILAWLNADDFYLPWTLQAVGTSFAAISDMDWQTTFYPGFCDVHARSVSFHRATGFSRESFLDGRHCPNDTRFIGYVPQESTFWRRSLWERAGGLASGDAPLAGDFDLWARFAEHAQIHTTTSSLAVFRHQSRQRSLDVEAYTREARASLARVNARLGRTIDELTSVEGAGRFVGFFEPTPGHKSTTNAPERDAYEGLCVGPMDLESPDAGWGVKRYRFS